MEPGYEKASDQNLPAVDAVMVMEFFQSNANFQDPELRNVKTTRATREAYGDNAIGYVQLQRRSKFCNVKARVTPEHKVSKTAYHVTVTIDEEDEVVTECKCIDCPAAEGGCKHGIALLLWLHRKASTPSVTEKTCYWKASKLSKVGSTLKFVTLKDLSTRSVPSLPDTEATNDFLDKILSEGRTTGSAGNIFLDKYPTDSVSKVCIHKLYLQFRYNSYIQTSDEFIIFAQNHITAEDCKNVEQRTCLQFKSTDWYRARYGRITASNFYEASKCRTAGSLTTSILGSCKPIMTPAIQRGRDLEKEVLKVVIKAYDLQLKSCGLFLSPNYPILGASPDGLTDTHVIEIKCPTKMERVKDYINEDGQPTKKPYCQIQLQMFMTNRKYGYFVVASPDFEESKAFQVSEIDFDEDFVKNMIIDAEYFWKNFVFPQL